MRTAALFTSENTLWNELLAGEEFREEFDAFGACGAANIAAEDGEFTEAGIDIALLMFDGQFSGYRPNCKTVSKPAVPAN